MRAPAAAVASETVFRETASEGEQGTNVGALRVLPGSSPVVPLGAWWEQGLPQRRPAWSRPCVTIFMLLVWGPWLCGVWGLALALHHWRGGGMMEPRATHLHSPLSLLLFTQPLGHRAAPKGTCKAKAHVVKSCTRTRLRTDLSSMF